MFNLFSVWTNPRFGHISVSTVPENCTWTWKIDKKDSIPSHELTTMGFFTATAERTTEDTVPIKIECNLRKQEGE